MKKVMMTLMAVVFAITANAQYNTNYYNQYGGKVVDGTVSGMFNLADILQFVIHSLNN